MAERIERTWDGKTFVFVNCDDYDETDFDRVEAESDYTVVQLSCSTSNFWQAAPGPLVFRSGYLFVWTSAPMQALSDFADAVIAIYNALQDPADFVDYSFINGRCNTLS